MIALAYVRAGIFKESQASINGPSGLRVMLISRARARVMIWSWVPAVFLKKTRQFMARLGYGLCQVLGLGLGLA